MKGIHLGTPFLTNKINAVIPAKFHFYRTVNFFRILPCSQLQYNFKTFKNFLIRGGNSQ